MSKLCFFVTPIGMAETAIRLRSDRILDYLIRPTLGHLGYGVIRLDRLEISGSLTAQIRTLIQHADLVIADLTTSNANVFYELGLRHATAKPCIQLIEVGEMIPFDVADIRTIFVDSSSIPRLKRSIPVLLRYVRAAQELGHGPVYPPSPQEVAAYIARARATDPAYLSISSPKSVRSERSSAAHTGVSEAPTETKHTLADKSDAAAAEDALISEQPRPTAQRLRNWYSRIAIAA